MQQPAVTNLSTPNGKYRKFGIALSLSALVYDSIGCIRCFGFWPNTLLILAYCSAAALYMGGWQVIFGLQLLLAWAVPRVIASGIDALVSCLLRQCSSCSEAESNNILARHRASIGEASSLILCAVAVLLLDVGLYVGVYYLLQYLPHLIGIPSWEEFKSHLGLGDEILYGFCILIFLFCSVVLARVIVIEVKRSILEPRRRERTSVIDKLRKNTVAQVREEWRTKQTQKGSANSEEIAALSAVVDLAARGAEAAPREEPMLPETAKESLIVSTDADIENSETQTTVGEDPSVVASSSTDSISFAGRFKPEDDEERVALDSLTHDCSICLVPYSPEEPVVFACERHCFHTECLRQSLVFSADCPLCRYPTLRGGGSLQAKVVELSNAGDPDCTIGLPLHGAFLHWHSPQLPLWLPHIPFR